MFVHIAYSFTKLSVKQQNGIIDYSNAYSIIYQNGNQSKQKRPVFFAFLSEIFKKEIFCPWNPSEFYNFYNLCYRKPKNPTPNRKRKRKNPPVKNRNSPHPRQALA